LINLIEGAPTPTEKGYVLPQSDKPMSIENHKNFKEPRAVCHLARSTMLGAIYSKTVIHSVVSGFSVR
jgi:hypothetical protein